MEQNKQWLKCYKCGHEWESGGQLEWVTCPNGMHKIKVKKARRNYVESKKK